MKLPIARRLPITVLSLSLVTTAFFSAARAGEGGYVPPRFMSGGSNQFAAMPFALQQASPLAGGPAAAQGGQFMDVQGNSIVLPASYSQPYPGGDGGYPSGPGAAGYGDPMAVDFGGYGTDQSGPHYFDVSLETVFLKPLDTFSNIGPVFSAGLSGNPAQGNRIDLLSGQNDYEAGWKIAARYDLGPLSVIEGTYMGIYDIGFNRSITSLDATAAVNPPATQNQLFSIFSNFGFAPVGGIDGLDSANVYKFSYKSDLQSTEISYRRYWMANNSRLTGTFLLGFRYLRRTENFSWATETFLNGNPASPANALLSTRTENDLVGFQFGGDGWYTLRQGLRIGSEGKAGVYNNRFKTNQSGVYTGVATPDFSVPTDGNQVAFAAESSVTLVADILPSLSIRGGYQVMYLSSLASIDDSIDATVIGLATSTQGDALYHGFSGGVEYVW